MLEDRIIAFIDVLGFRQAVNRIQDGDNHTTKAIQETLQLIRDFARATSEDRSTLSGVKSSWFSDSIVLSAEVPDYWKVAHAVGVLSSRLCLGGMLTRGGIAKGLCYHSEGVCFGPALIAAYDLESKVAVYPRIVIQQSLADEEAKNKRNRNITEVINIGPTRNHQVRHGEDGLLWIDVLSPFFSRLHGFSGGPGKDYTDYMAAVKTALEIQFHPRPNEVVAAKLHWFAHYFNRCAEEASSEGVNIAPIENKDGIKW